MSSRGRGRTRFWGKAITLAVGLLFCLLVHPAAGQLIISEFRLSGPNGESDEFIEIYNNSGADHTVASVGTGSTGYAIVASDGTARFVIPNGTVIPNRGHYLGCNGSGGYSLTSYPAGNGTTATCDATYTTGIPLNSGIAIFNSSLPANFVLANRLDAVGSTAVANTLYKEGTGVRNLIANTTNYSYQRRLGGGCIGTDPAVIDSNCTSETAIEDTVEPTTSTPIDTNNNRNNFIFVNTAGSNVSAEEPQSRRGAPSPENLTSPIMRQTSFRIELLDPAVCENCPPNRVRDLNNDPAVNNDAFGSVLIRRKFINQTGGNVTRLRIRVVDITTSPAGVFFLAPAPNTTCGSEDSLCAADLRPMTSGDATVTLTTGGAPVQVRGTTLEQAASPANQPNGGGFYSSLSAGAVTLATPLANGAAINLQFRLGVEQQGAFRFTFLVEALP